MKKTLFFMIVVSLFLSCHKNKNGNQVTCDSNLIGTLYVSTSSTSYYVTLSSLSSNTGQTIKSYTNLIQVGDNYSAARGVYDHIHNCYYLYGSVGNSLTAELYCLNTNTGNVRMLGYPVYDPANNNYFFNNLVCNNKTGKLYFFGSNSYNWANSIYEITPNDTGFSERLVFDSVHNNSGLYIFSPVIDENTGYIYFFVSSSGVVGDELTLMKVDPVSGHSSFVAYSGISPFIGLIYNNNDGLFYGLNIYNLTNYPLTMPSAGFISINPGTGVITTIVDTISSFNYNNNNGTTFDFCANSYIILDSPNIWIDPSTGNVVKQLNYKTSFIDVGVY